MSKIIQSDTSDQLCHSSAGGFLEPDGSMGRLMASAIEKSFADLRKDIIQALTVMTVIQTVVTVSALTWLAQSLSH